VIRGWGRRRGAMLPSPPKWRHNHWPARSVENFVVSFPKSGRTWLRVMMAVAESQSRGVAGHEVIAEWLAEEAPRLGGAPLLFTHALSVPAHEPARGMDLFLEYIEDRRRLFFVRDPRDVVVSHYFQTSRRARRQPDYDPRSVGDFVRDPDRGIDRVLLFFGACERSLRSGSGLALRLAYEDLHADPTAGLGAALAFFGAQASPAALKLAVEFGSFENMQRLERKGEFAHDNRRLVARDPSDPESFKTRRGEVGGYREYISDDDVVYIEERIATLLPETFGYREPGVSATTLAAPTPG
jgi:hypothetical protein